MVPDVFYRGYRIVFDVQREPNSTLWKATKAAVVAPTDASGVERVHPIGAAGYFQTEEGARDFLLAEAKKWIDAQCGDT